MSQTDLKYIYPLTVINPTNIPVSDGDDLKTALDKLQGQIDYIRTSGGGGSGSAVPSWLPSNKAGISLTVSFQLSAYNSAGITLQQAPSKLTISESLGATIVPVVNVTIATVENIGVSLSPNTAGTIIKPNSAGLNLSPSYSGVIVPVENLGVSVTVLPTTLLVSENAGVTVYTLASLLLTESLSVAVTPLVSGTILNTVSEGISTTQVVNAMISTPVNSGVNLTPSVSASIIAPESIGINAGQSPVSLTIQESGGVTLTSIYTATITNIVNTGASIALAPLQLTIPESTSLSLTSVYQGVVMRPQSSGLSLSNIAMLAPVLEAAGFSQKKITIGLVSTQVASSATNTRNSGSTDWTNVNNSVGAPDGTSATITSGVLTAAFSATLTNLFPALFSKTGLTIIQVQLVFTSAFNKPALTAPTMAMSYSTNGGTSYTTLATIAATTAGPLTYDITAAIGGDWSKLQSFRTQQNFTAPGAAGTGANASCDAVQLIITASTEMVP